MTITLIFWLSAEVYPSDHDVIAEAEQINPSAQSPYRLPADDKERADAIASLKSTIAPYMNLAPGSSGAHPSARAFPGIVPPDQTRRETVSVTVPATTPRWLTTGLYANAGEVVNVSFPGGVPRDLGKITIRIGCHTDDLLNVRQTQWKRFPRISRTFTVDHDRVTIGSAFGGSIFMVIEKPKSDSKPISVTFENAARAPTFVLGTTTQQQWDAVRDAPAPWAELVGKNMILHVPSAQVRQLANPTELLGWWDKVVEMEDDLVAWPPRQVQERVVPDVQISAGFMHSGYPFMCHLSSARDITDLAKLRKDGEWGFFHELGHNHQSNDWTFDGQGEVTVNFFSMYVMEKLVGKPPEAAHPALKNLDAMVAKCFADPKQSDPFVKLSPFVVLIHEFGYDPLKTTLQSYKKDPIKKGLDAAAKQAIFVKRYSIGAGRNLAPFFEKMGYAIDPETRAELDKLPTFDFQPK